MSKVEKIRKEIERLKKSLPWGSCASQLSMECNCKNEAYNEVLSYIDSLKEPVKRTPAEIEAAMQEIEEKSKLFTEAHKDDVVSNDTIDDLEEAAVEAFKQIVDSDKNNFLEIFKAGAEWQKEKMMEDAVDGKIYFSMDMLQYRIITEPLGNFHHGDKVKLIIIKEE